MVTGGLAIAPIGADRPRSDKPSRASHARCALIASGISTIGVSAGTCRSSRSRTTARGSPPARAAPAGRRRPTRRRRRRQGSRSRTSPQAPRTTARDDPPPPQACSARASCRAKNRDFERLALVVTQKMEARRHVAENVPRVRPEAHGPSRPRAAGRRSPHTSSSRCATRREPRRRVRVKEAFAQRPRPQDDAQRRHRGKLDRRLDPGPSGLPSTIAASADSASSRRVTIAARPGVSGDTARQRFTRAVLAPRSPVLAPRRAGLVRRGPRSSRGSCGARRSQIHSASTSLVGCSSPSMSLSKQ